MSAEERREWLGIEEFAAEIGVPVRTVYAWRLRKVGPRGYKLGKHVRFRRGDVETWLEQHADSA